MDARKMNPVVWLLAGVAAGSVHFALLRWNTSLYLSPGGLAGAICIQTLRLASIALLLAFAAWHGALALLSVALGIVLARSLMLHALRAAP
jgi:N-ATPase, AtpR subunit